MSRESLHHIQLTIQGLENQIVEVFGEDCIRILLNEFQPAVARIRDDAATAKLWRTKLQRFLSNNAPITERLSGATDAETSRSEASGAVQKTDPYNDPVRLRRALEESLKLQAQYAELLNTYDGGTRIIFSDVPSWFDRLRKTGTLP